MPSLRILLGAGLLLGLSACAGDMGGGGIFSGSTTAPPPPEESTTTVPESTGIVAGTSVGGTLGAQLTSEDQARMREATQSALETGRSGEAVKWINPGSGNSGEITPQPSFQMDGRPCREFQQTLTVGGEFSTGYGTACRNSRGVWVIAESG
jgi:surface antigen